MINSLFLKELIMPLSPPFEHRKAWGDSWRLTDSKKIHSYSLSLFSVWLLSRRSIPHLLFVTLWKMLVFTVILILTTFQTVKPKCFCRLEEKTVYCDKRSDVLSLDDISTKCKNRATQPRMVILIIITIKIRINSNLDLIISFLN